MTTPTTSHLSVAADPFNAQGERRIDNEQRRAPRAPIDFEGVSVELTDMTIAALNKVEIDERVLSADDYVELKITCRVLGVNHKIDEKNKDQMRRHHLLKIVEVDIIKSWPPAGGIEYV